MIHLVARIFGRHPDEIRETMTLRQALKYIAYEIDIWQGKPSILQQPSPKQLQAAKERLRAEAAAFFRLHKETLNDKAV